MPLVEPLADLIGESPAMGRLRKTVRSFLRRQAGGRRLPPVLITGETGTGKGLLARVLHRAGPRGDGPFIDVQPCHCFGSTAAASLVNTLRSSGPWTRSRSEPSTGRPGPRCSRRRAASTSMRI